MLTSLRIRNLALVEDLEWSPGDGFVAITGETGSGKSIIIGALKLLLGERADKSLIRTGAESCTVEAVFHLEDFGELNGELASQGIEPCADSTLILKRTFSVPGASRQFVNCCATTLAVLKTIGDGLVDLHGPHDHQSLLSSEKQLGLLDSFAGAETLRGEYQAHFRNLNRLVAEHDSLSASESSLEREIDLLKHQAGEISSADLLPDEEEPLLARYSQATNSRRLIELATQILQRLSEDDGAVLSRLAEVQRLFRELEKTDATTAEIAESHAGAVVEIEEAARSLRQYSERLDINPEQLAQLEERVSLIETLKRKYGATLADVIAFGENATERLRKIESRGEELERLRRDIDETRKALMESGVKLGKKRRSAAPKLAADIKAQLRDLGFKKSEFSISLVPVASGGQDGKISAHGLENAEFLFAPNPGEPEKPLKSIASSGEISRVMLAVKTSLASQDRIPLLVFDEIDANVGGEIAHAVGAKMRSLGREHQVLCITHLPQVAAAAASQFVVSKEFTKGRTLSLLTGVSGDSRVVEIARMLGGKTDSALAHARTLLG
jgi:DNA repair protein RecN (Recombination protein N)